MLLTATLTFGKVDFKATMLRKRLADDIVRVDLIRFFLTGPYYYNVDLMSQFVPMEGKSNSNNKMS